MPATDLRNQWADLVRGLCGGVLVRMLTEEQYMSDIEDIMERFSAGKLTFLEAAQELRRCGFDTQEAYDYLKESMA